MALKDDVSMVTGRVFYNPATQEVYEYPTYVQTIEPFTINAKDGSEFKVDPNVNLKVKDAPKVFRKYRKELTDVINGPVFKYVKMLAVLRLINLLQTRLCQIVKL